MLRSVKKVARGDGSALWQPIAPGGPSRYDHFNAILLDAFKDQMAGSIRRLKASKPIAVKTRKVVAAMLDFYRCGKPESAYEADDTTRHYSYEHDYDLIFAAFLNAYGIDLLDPSTRLHWFKFRAKNGMRF